MFGTLKKFVSDDWFQTISVGIKFVSEYQCLYRMMIGSYTSLISELIILLFLRMNSIDFSIGGVTPRYKSFVRVRTPCLQGSTGLVKCRHTLSSQVSEMSFRCKQQFSKVHHQLWICGMHIVTEIPAAQVASVFCYE